MGLKMLTLDLVSIGWWETLTWEERGIEDWDVEEAKDDNREKEENGREDILTGKAEEEVTMGWDMEEKEYETEEEKDKCERKPR